MKNNKNEKVTITLFCDGGRYKDDLFVSVNGKRYSIKRGESVTVPRSVAEVIERSQIQDSKTAQFITSLGERV